MKGRCGAGLPEIYCTFDRLKIKFVLCDTGDLCVVTRKCTRSPIAQSTSSRTHLTPGRPRPRREIPHFYDTSLLSYLSGKIVPRHSVLPTWCCPHGAAAHAAAAAAVAAAAGRGGSGRLEPWDQRVDDGELDGLREEEAHAACLQRASPHRQLQGRRRLGVGRDPALRPRVRGTSRPLTCVYTATRTYWAEQASLPAETCSRLQATSQHTTCVWWFRTLLCTCRCSSREPSPPPTGPPPQSAPLCILSRAENIYEE